MRLMRFFTCVFLLLFPAVAFAMQETVWSFENKQVPGDWNVAGLEHVTGENEGLHIVTSTDGKMGRKNDALHSIHVVLVAVESTHSVNALLEWRNKGQPAGEVFQIPLSIPAGRNVIGENMLEIDAWDGQPEGIGLVFPAGSDLRIGEIRLQSWSVPEQLGYLWQSFWKFDDIEPYSINFLWGPVLTRTPVGLANLFIMRPPPRGWSFNRLMLPLLGIVLIVTFAWWKCFPSGRRRGWGGLPRALAVFLSVCAAGWLVWDLRMGLEFLTYAHNDYVKYIGEADPEKKRVRNFGTIYSLINQVKANLQEQPRYVVLQPAGYPFVAIARYLTYPSVPLPGGQSTDGIRYWLVLEQDDLKLNDQGQLTRGADVLTASGKVIKIFPHSSFLFRIN